LSVHRAALTPSCLVRASAGWFRLRRLHADRDIAHRIPITVLPVGTANNIARSLGIEGEVGGLLSGLSNAKTRYLDVGLARGPWGERNFLEAVGCGSIAEAIAHSGPKPPKPIRDELPSEGLVRGALQVPRSGKPVLFLADHPVTGGYPVIGYVVDADVDRCAQLRPGQQLLLREGRTHGGHRR